MFTEAVTGLCSEPDESILQYHTSILILSSPARLYLSSGLFPLCFPTKTHHALIVSPVRARCFAQLI